MSESGTYGGYYPAAPARRWRGGSPARPVLAGAGVALAVLLCGLQLAGAGFGSGADLVPLTARALLPAVGTTWMTAAAAGVWTVRRMGARLPWGRFRLGLVAIVWAPLPLAAAPITLAWLPAPDLPGFRPVAAAGVALVVAAGGAAGWYGAGTAAPPVAAIVTLAAAIGRTAGYAFVPFASALDPDLDVRADVVTHLVQRAELIHGAVAALAACAAVALLARRYSGILLTAAAPVLAGAAGTAIPLIASGTPPPALSYLPLMAGLAAGATLGALLARRRTPTPDGTYL